MELNFVTGEAALAIGKALVIADLHIGAEHDYRAAGITMPSRTGDAEKKLIGLVETAKAKRLIILGDVKHRVPGASFQEEREVPQLLSRLSHHVSVEVVPGNHDGGLEKLCPDITMHPSEGIMVDGFCLTHGHAWPDAEAMDAKAVIIGHNHPQIEFRDKLGHRWRERVWIRTSLKKKPLSSHYKKLPKKLPDLILMPAFGTLVGGWAVNNPRDDGRLVGGLGPLTRCADMKKALAYMLDGTFLGEISKI
jgi:putative SbcD/Mre11-related phosphoesterase